MFTYKISTGEMIDSDGVVIGTGYSGLGDDKNQTSAENVQGQGPIPEGLWHIGFVDEEKGPLTIHLTPDDTTDTHGRSGFLIHGDSSQHPGAASHGCIVIGPGVRQEIADSPDKLLQVVA